MRYWEVHKDGRVYPTEPGADVPGDATVWMLPDDIAPELEETVLSFPEEGLPPATSHDFRFPAWPREEALSIAKRALLEALDTVASVVMAKYPEAERASWAIKAAEAKKVLSFSGGPPPENEIPTLLSEVEAARQAGRTDLTLETLAKKVLEAAPRYAALSGMIAGFRSATEDRLAKAKTMPEMQAVLRGTMNAIRKELAGLGINQGF